MEPMAVIQYFLQLHPQEAAAAVVKQELALLVVQEAAAVMAQLEMLEQLVKVTQAATRELDLQKAQAVEQEQSAVMELQL
jgi:hypothetical protein